MDKCDFDKSQINDFKTIKVLIVQYWTIIPNHTTKLLKDKSEFVRRYYEVGKPDKGVTLFKKSKEHKMTKKIMILK